MANDLFYLEDRCLIEVSGQEALSFLQNLITQDMSLVTQTEMQYGCLLTPQGQFLHEFFIFSSPSGGYFLDTETSEKEKLIRRLSLFKLRSKISIANRSAEFHVFACFGTPLMDRPDLPKGMVYADPRHKRLGFRAYSSEKYTSAGMQAAYRDFSISLGISPGSTAFRPGKDYLSDINLDQLHAVSFEKGCFVGQELTARMHHRGLAKKRLLIVQGAELKQGKELFQGESGVGEIRCVSSDRKTALALLKLEALATTGKFPLHTSGGSVTATVPGWLTLKSITSIA